MTDFFRSCPPPRRFPRLGRLAPPLHQVAKTNAEKVYVVVFMLVSAFFMVRAALFTELLLPTLRLRAVSAPPGGVCLSSLPLVAASHRLLPCPQATITGQMVTVLSKHSIIMAREQTFKARARAHCQRWAEERDASAQCVAPRILRSVDELLWTGSF